MFLLLLTMPGSQADETNWENLTNKELHDKFQQMMSGQVQDVLNRFEEAMEKIDGMEKTFETKLYEKFNELLARHPATFFDQLTLHDGQHAPKPLQGQDAERQEQVGP